MIGTDCFFSLAKLAEYAEGKLFLNIPTGLTLHRRAGKDYQDTLVILYQFQEETDKT